MSWFRKFIGRNDKEQRPQPGFIGWMKNSIFNLQYSQFKPSKEISDSPAKQRYLGGKSRNAAEAKEYLHNILWFTYRQRQILMGDHTSDTGWGCMVRVGQMCLAQCLKIHHLKHLSLYKTEKEICMNLLHSFQDNNKFSQYSLDRIINGKSAIVCGIKQGKWVGVGQIACCLSELHNEYPLKAYQELKLIPFTEGAIYYSQLAETMGFKLCKHNYIKCSECKNTPSKCNSVVIIVSGVLAEDRTCIKQMMKVSQFVGMLGGIPGKAHFFTGFEKVENQNVQLVYLDPHFVQQATIAGTTDENTYFCPDYLTVSIQKIDRSVGLCFYLSDPSDVAEFQQSLWEISVRYRDSMPFGIVNRPQNCIQSNIQEEEIQNSSFQDLNGPNQVTKFDLSITSWHIN